MKSYAWLLGVLALCLSVTTGAYAQDTRGSIEGVVKDASGAVLPGATVEATSPSLVGVQSTTSDTNGVYRFPALAAGNLRSLGHAFGLQHQEGRRTFSSNLGQTLKVDFALADCGRGGIGAGDGGVAAHRRQGQRGRRSASRRRSSTASRRDATSLASSTDAPGTSQRGPRRRHHGGRRVRRRRTVSSSTASIDQCAIGRGHCHHRHRGRDVRTSSSRCRSSRRATTRSTARRSAASSTRSPRAAATRSTARPATYYTDNKLLGDIRQTLRLPTDASGRVHHDAARQGPPDRRRR